LLHIRHPHTTLSALRYVNLKRNNYAIQTGLTAVTQFHTTILSPFNNVRLRTYTDMPRMTLQPTPLIYPALTWDATIILISKKTDHPQYAAAAANVNFHIHLIQHHGQHEQTRTTLHATKFAQQLSHILTVCHKPPFRVRCTLKLILLYSLAHTQNAKTCQGVTPMSTSKAILPNLSETTH
jgi:hypothetical protein